MPLTDWIRARRSLIVELEAAREHAAAEARKAAAAQHEADRFLRLLRKEQEAHRATQRVLDAALESVEDVFAPATPRTPGQELALMRKHVEALEQRLHDMQQWSMAADRR